jgi:hypothetical protein
MGNIVDALVDLDSNGYPVYSDSPFKTVKEHTFVGNNATVVVPIFTLTGSVMITRLWGEVTTVLGNNHTAASFRINDQTAQVYLTAVGGVTMSSLKAGSLILKTGLVAAAAVAVTNAAGAIAEPTTLQTGIFTPVAITKKTAAVTQIEYRYATTNTPTTGAMKFYVAWYPLSADGKLVAA